MAAHTLVGSILADHTNSSLENMDWVAEEEDIGHTDTEKTLLEKRSRVEKEKLLRNKPALLLILLCLKTVFVCLWLD